MRNSPAKVASVLLLALSGCAGMQSALNPAGAQADTISHVWWTFFWVNTAIYVLVLFSVFYVIFRRRHGEPRSHAPEMPPANTSERRMTITVASLTGITI